MSNLRGRPIVVYDDDHVESSKTNAGPSFVLNSNRVKRLPGRDISISSSEDDSDGEEDLSSMASRIEIIEDPKNSKVAPRKSSLAVHPTNVNLPRSTSGSVNAPRFEECASTSYLSNPEAGDCSSPLQARKRSVSFLSLAVEINDEEEPFQGGDPKKRDEDEEEEARTLLKVSTSARARERRKSIESIVRPPTPPNVSHKINY